MAFSPRRGSYIRQHRGRYYYRRAIPSKVRHLFDGKTEWAIPLEGRSSAERFTEAQAIADRHNRQIRMTQEVAIPDRETQDVACLRIDLAPDDLPPGAPAPVPERFYRDGRVFDVFRYAITDDPAQRRAAEADGFYVVSVEEEKAQMEMRQRMAEFEAAESDDAREIADLKAEKVATKIDGLAHVSGHTVTSILDPWRNNRKQAPTTWKKHTQYAREFAELHGDLALEDVTKRHVVEYVQHAAALTYQGKPLSPTSIAKRLDSIRALLGYAAEIDVIDANPATGVKAPKDSRPKTSRSWKSFEPAEVRKLVDVSSALWSKRRDKRPGRARDLTAALQVLIWTGARPEEVCQLRRDDVDLTRGVLRITNDDSDDDARPRLTKNENSVREVPIHSRLLPLLIDHLRYHNAPLLFPSFEPEATPAELEEATRTGHPVEIKGRYARPISRAWTDELRHKVTDDPRKVLYSLRHSWSAESRRTGMPEHVRNALLGHANDNQHAGRYGGDADWTDDKRRHLERMDCLPA
ncbi:tyrosine-type recombinase/integrase [Palleronia abyssalis]|uniref:Tyrosine recombinase XerC n=1 Tax=Palleronia abyssalis TaxID=1501240 RepID=A0A2R8BY94_9RHOB|nr:tyrosine-type recombinase/integrase [Palleronia abyssalis]SPJ25046.1 Tyrosine recombinase XerC [Palleronia abyssalis]